MSGHKTYDKSYKLLFSEPQMVRDLLIGFFPEKWIDDLDFDTLDRLTTSYITETLRERDSDVVWKVKWKNEWMYLLIFIEFQSTVDPFMVVRLLAYVTLLYLDIIKTDKGIQKTRKLPPILPIVLYNGRNIWTGSLSFKDLFPEYVPKALRKYQPSFEFWLLDEVRCTLKNEKVDLGNLVSPLIALEQANKPADMAKTVNWLIDLLKHPSLDSVRRAYLILLKRTLRIRKMLPDDIELNELHEVGQMLSERVDEWMEEATKKGLKKGMKKGMEKGIKKGIKKGEIAIISYQLNEKFGPLTSAQQAFLETLSGSEVFTISKRILHATSIDEVFAKK